MKTTTGFNVRAVDGEGGSLYGVVRMIRKRGLFKVYGICGVFEVDEQRENLHFDKESLFFYGSTRDLKKNYYREIPFSDLELKSFKDKSYSEKTYSADIIGDSEIGFVSIPLEEMRLDHNRKGLVDRLISEAEEKLPNLVNELIRVKIRYDDHNFMKMFGHMFSTFPRDLREKALQNGSFYKLPGREK